MTRATHAGGRSRTILLLPQLLAAKAACNGAAQSAKHNIESSHRAGGTHESISPCSQAHRTRGPQYPGRPFGLLRRSSSRNRPVRLALHHPRARRERFCGRLVRFLFYLFFPFQLQLILLTYERVMNSFWTLSFFYFAHFLSRFPPQSHVAPGTTAASSCPTSIRTNPRSSCFAHTMVASKWAKKSASVFRSIIPKNGRRLGGFVQHSRPSARS
jgi:hypothetical protein